MFSGKERKPLNTMDCSLSVCFACLSSDRILRPLGENIRLFAKLLDNDPTICQHTVLLCWECMAILRKVKLFKQKVDHAQSVISYHYLTQNPAPISLSTLTHTINNHDDAIIVKENTLGNEPKLEIDIKQETDVEQHTDWQQLDSQQLDYQQLDSQQLDSQQVDSQDLDAETFYEPTDYVHLEDIKTEDKKLIMKIKNLKELKELIQKSTVRRKLKKRRYKRLSTSIKATSKTVTIPYSEVPYWMETDRRSEFFKQLRHKCDLCVIKMRSSVRKIHWKNWHTSDSKHKYKCDLCTCTYAKKNVLVKHMKNHNQIKECTVCGFRCYCREYMKHHLGLHERSVQCEVCLHKLSSVAEFSKHFRELHRLYQCDNCPKKCYSKKTIEKHMIRNHLPLVCKECNVSFKNYNNYKNHCKLKHVKQMTEEAFCVPCNRQFANPMEYKNHINSAVAHKHERGPPKVKKERTPCPECPKTYMKRQSMLNHWRLVHKKESRYRCDQCGLQVLNHTKLVDHVRFKHEGAVRDKNKLCNICGRGFATNRILIQHVRTHTGERPYQCRYCLAKFAQPYAMQSHVKFVHLKAKRRPVYGDFSGFGDLTQ